MEPILLSYEAQFRSDLQKKHWSMEKRGRVDQSILLKGRSILQNFHRGRWRRRGRGRGRRGSDGEEGEGGR